MLFLFQGNAQHIDPSEWKRSSNPEQRRQIYSVILVAAERRVSMFVTNGVNDHQHPCENWWHYCT
jgi:hypothetical protein